MTLPLNYDLPSAVTCTPVSKMFNCQKKCASLNQWNEECYLPAFWKHFNQWPSGSGPIWDLRHKGPFPPWLLPAHSTETDAIYNSPTQQWVGDSGGTPLPTKWATVSQQPVNALFYHCSGPLKAPSPSLLLYTTLYNSGLYSENNSWTTLNPDWDKMVFGHSSLPSPLSATLLIKVIIPCSNNSSLNLLACHASNRTSLGLVTIFLSICVVPYSNTFSTKTDFFSSLTLSYTFIISHFSFLSNSHSWDLNFH